MSRDDSLPTSTRPDRDSATTSAAAALVAGWSELGPFHTGRLSAILVKESNPSWMMVASPGGGLWRSTNGGTTWSRPSSLGANGLGDLSIVHLEWDLASATRIFALTYNGLYTSTDDGTTWTQRLGTGATPAPLWSFGSGPADRRPFSQMWSGGTRVIFAARPCQGIAWSTNAVTFNTRNPWPGTGPYDNCVGAIAADSASGMVYVAASQGVAGQIPRVRRCYWAGTGNCQTSAWVDVQHDGDPMHPMPTGRAIAAMTAASTSSSARIVSVMPNSSGSGTLTYATTSTGLAWTFQGETTLLWDDSRALQWRGGATNELLWGSVYQSWTGNLGATWTWFQSPQQHPDTRGFYVNGARTRVWSVTDGDLYDSAYSVVTSAWGSGTAPATPTQVPDTGVNSLQQFFVAPIKRGGSTASRWLLTGGMDNGGGCSSNGGSSWTFYSPSHDSQGSGDHLSVVQACVPSGGACDPAASRAYFFNNGDVYRSTNLWSATTCSAVVWTYRGSPTVSAPFSARQIAARPGYPDEVYVADNSPSGVVRVSTNGGQDYTPTPVLPDNARPVSVYVAGGGSILVGTGRTGGSGSYHPARGIYRLDPGGSWVPWGLNASPPEFVNAITATGTGGTLDTFWAATTAGIWRKAPFGSWQLVLNTPGYGSSDIAIDPQDSNRVYVGRGFVNQIQEHRGGILFTDDGGVNWCSLTSGWLLHNTPIADVEVDPYDSTRIWAATFGAGVFAFDGAGAPPSCP